ncbi:MAG TPA: ACP phosphodiesterase [Povalibacter sp.]|nr:ACP phosphodiesterase [Povalibacter sp.]
MNWLAHTFLSEPGVEFRLGNLLADLVRGDDRAAMSEEFRRGADCHKAIDAFTDSHPLVRRSRARVESGYRRFSGVLVDVFYDYLLATHWAEHAATPLEQFTADFYAAVATRTLPLPEPVRATLERIVRHDSLGSYQRIDGVERALRRMSTYLSGRWRREFALERSIPGLLAEEAGFAMDFAEFFPQLKAHVEDHLGQRIL